MINKKLFFLLSSITTTFGIVSLSLLSMKVGGTHVMQDYNYDFTNYNANNTNGAISSDIGTKVAIASNGLVAYGTASDGFSAGQLKGNAYSFYNYNEDNELINNSIGALAFNSVGDNLAIGENSSDGEDSVLQIFSSDFASGEPFIHDYTAQNNDGLLSGPITGIAFNNYDDANQIIISFAKNTHKNTEGGISIGTYNRNLPGYVFESYKEGSNSNFKGTSATSVAISPIAGSQTDLIAVGTVAGGLNIGISGLNGITFTNYNSDTISAFNTEINGVAFNSQNGLALSLARSSNSDGAGLAYGVPDASNQYGEFTTYSNSLDGISSNEGANVSFSYNDQLAYTTESGGLSIAPQDQGSGNYSDFTNYNSSLDGGVASDNGKDASFAAKASNRILYASDSGLDIGKPAGSPNVSFDLNDLNYNLEGANTYSISNFNFTLAFDNNTSQSGYYVQILIVNTDSLMPLVGIYLDESGSVPSDAQETQIPSFAIAYNSDLSYFNYMVPNYAINSLVSTNSYNLEVTYGNSQEQQEGVLLTKIFTPSGTINNTFKPSDVAYQNQTDGTVGISAIAFNFSGSLQNVVSQDNYILIVISNSSGAKLVGLYITLDGELPPTVNTDISEILTTQTINANSSYLAGNIITKFKTHTTYTVTYYVAANEEENLHKIGDSVNFVTPRAPFSSHYNRVALGIGVGIGGTVLLGGLSFGVLVFFRRRKYKT